MNKLSMTFVKVITLAFALMIGALVVGCKSTTEPASSQEYDSEAAADITASSLGTESGGAGNSFADVQALSEGNEIPGIIVSKNSPMSHSVSYDSTNGLHTVTVERGGTHEKYSFSDTIIYLYTFYDASGKFMQKFQKGVTDKITVSFTKQRSKDIGERVDIDNTASGSWTVTNLTSTQPLFNGSFARNGTNVFHTANNGDRTFTHSFTINFLNDTLVKDKDLKHVYLLGPATSHFEATTPKYNFQRDVKITFNGDGTAFLDVTRTSGDGTVDSYTIDVKVGYWKWKGKIK
jgi:hypothetical protein